MNDLSAFPINVPSGVASTAIGNFAPSANFCVDSDASPVATCIATHCAANNDNCRDVLKLDFCNSSFDDGNQYNTNPVFGAGSLGD